MPADLRLHHPRTGSPDLRLGSDTRPGDLRLDRPRTGGADLRIGAPVAGRVPEITADIALGEVAVDALLGLLAEIRGDIPLAEISLDAAAAYDPDVWRGLTHHTGAPHRSAGLIRHDIHGAWEDSVPHHIAASASWDRPAHRADHILLAWILPADRRLAILTPWTPGRGLQNQKNVSWRYSAPRRLAPLLPWARALRLRQSCAGPWIGLPPRRHEDLIPWGHAVALGRPRGLPWRPTPAPRRHGHMAPWDQAHPPIHLWPRPVPPPPPPSAPPPILRDAGLYLACLADDLPRLQVGRICLAAGYRIPILRAYIMQHDISIVRLPGREAIPARALTLHLDADAYAWTCQADLLGPHAIGLVDPMGGEVVLEIAIDGRAWRILVEDWTQTRSFGDRGARITGRSLTARLTDRYHTTRTYTETADRTIQQLAAAELDVGWSLTWEPADWLVPAGAWSYRDLAPMAAIGRLADAAGAIVVPDPAAQALTVRPRYPVMPWDLLAAPVALAVPEAAITGLETRYAPPSQADAVYVRGGEVGGVLAWVHRTGTAGARLLPERNEPLITHADGARALGGRLLAGAAPPPMVRSVTLPLDSGQFPLASMGDVVEIGLPDPVRGIVSGIDVTVTRGDRGAMQVRQRLRFGEDISVWRRWRDLLPQDPLLAGTVQAVHGDGTVTVALAGGGVWRVRGDQPVGASVYVRGGRVEGAAPALTQVEITI